LKKYPTLPVSAFAMLASVLFLAVLATGEGFFAAPPRFQVTVFLALSPVTAAVLGVLFLAEPVSAGALLALACVAAGLWLAHRPGE
jgi:drug/metabolite transporter (DMT)-like permease